MPPGTCCSPQNASPGAKYPIAALSVCICLITKKITAFCLPALLSEISLFWQAADRAVLLLCVYCVWRHREFVSPCSEPPLHLWTLIDLLTNVQLTFCTLNIPYITDLNLACFSQVDEWIIYYAKICDVVQVKSQYENTAIVYVYRCSGIAIVSTSKSQVYRKNVMIVSEKKVFCLGDHWQMTCCVVWSDPLVSTSLTVTVMTTEWSCAAPSTWWRAA